MSAAGVPVVVGLDVGTKSAKAMAYDVTGAPRGRAVAGLRTRHPAPLHVEQNPDEVTDAALGALRDAVTATRGRGDTVVAIALGTAMHSLVGVDALGRPRTPLVIYADGRAHAQAARLRGGDGTRMYRRTGTPVHPMSPLVKLRWFRDAAPEEFAAVDRWWSSKEYLLHRLLRDSWPGVVDVSVASATGLLALEERDWDEAALAWCGAGRERLSRPVPTRTVLGGMPVDTARALGLAGPVPVVLGAADGAAANLGVGALTPETGAVTVGTSGAVRAVVDRPLVDDAGRTFCYVLTADGRGDDRFVVGGATSNGGSVLRWLGQVLGQPEEDLPALLRAAERVAPGAEGLLVVPYLTGERAPRWQPGLSASVVGLRADHGRDHLVRAGLEGVALQLATILDAVADVAGRPRRLRATGGFTRSAVWPRIMADVLGVPLELVTTTEAGAFGVAPLGMHAMGLIDGLDAGARLAAVDRVLAPEEPAVSAYRSVKGAYVRAVAHLLDDDFLRVLVDARRV